MCERTCSFRDIAKGTTMLYGVCTRRLRDSISLHMHLYGGGRCCTEVQWQTSPASYATKVFSHGVAHTRRHGADSVLILCLPSCFGFSFGGISALSFVFAFLFSLSLFSFLRLSVSLFALCYFALSRIRSYLRCCLFGGHCGYSFYVFVEVLSRIGKFRESSPTSAHPS